MESLEDEEPPVPDHHEDRARTEAPRSVRSDIHDIRALTDTGAVTLPGRGRSKSDRIRDRRD